MFGDDLNPSVMKARVGFGEVFGRTKEGVGGCREVRWFDKRETKTRLVSERSTKARGDAATTNGCKFYENMQMQMMT